MLSIPDNYIFLLRNIEAVDECAPMIYQLLLNFGCKKKEIETYEEYVRNNELLKKCTKKVREAFKKNMDIVTNKTIYESTDVSNADVSFLHHLVEAICLNGNGVIQHQLRSSLLEVKELRNIVYHERANAKDPKIFCQLRNLAIKCIRDASKLFLNKSNKEIEEYIQQIEAKFDNIVLNTTQNYDTKIKYIRMLFMNECILEKHKYISKNIISLPGNHTIKLELQSIFYNIEMTGTVFSAVEKKYVEVNFPCTELLKTMKGEQIILIEGVAGSGKTTFMKNLFQNIIKKKADCPSLFSNTEKYELPLFIDCKSERCSHFGELLKETYPDTLKIFSPNEVLDALKVIENFIIIVDGYDEASEEAQNIVDEIIHFCFGIQNITLIISGRQHAISHLRSTMWELSLKFAQISIDQLDDNAKQVIFLEKYANALSGCNVRQLIEDFNNIPENVRNIFTSPMLLALFCFIYTESSNSTDLNIKSELDIFQAIYDITFEKLKKRLEERDFSNAKTCAISILAAVKIYSMKLFIAEQFSISLENLTKLVGECQRRYVDLIISELKLQYAIGANLISNVITENHHIFKSLSGKLIENLRTDYEDTLTDIISPEISAKFNKVSSYEYFHATMQEYFVSKNILENSLYTTPSLETSVEEILGSLGITHDNEEKRNQQIKRYEYIIKLIMLDLHFNNKLSNFVEPFREIMSKYLKPKLKYCLDLISATFCNDNFVRMFAEGISDTVWFVRQTSHYRAASKLIMARRPSSIEITVENELKEEHQNDLQELMITLRDMFDKRLTLNFDYYYREYKPIKEEILLAMKDARYKLNFKGHCPSDEVISILNDLKCSATISMECPVNHQLERLIDVSAFTAKFTTNIPDGATYPITRSRRAPVLTITDVPKNEVANLVKMIKYLVPPGKKFSNLHLVRCDMSEAQMLDVGKELMKDGIHTLHIARNNEPLGVSKAWYSVNPEFCHICNISHKEHCYRIYMADFWHVKRKEQLEVAAQFVRDTKFKSIGVFFKQEVNIRKLREFFASLRNHFSGELKMVLKHIYDSFCPLPEIVFQELKGSNFAMEDFTVCISSKESLQTLVSLKRETEYSLEELSIPSALHHNLGHFDRQLFYIKLMVPYTEMRDEDLLDPRPIPVNVEGDIPEFLLANVPEDGLQNAYRNILYLLPKTKIFCALCLKKCSLSAPDLDTLGKRLYDAGVRTESIKEEGDESNIDVKKWDIPTTGHEKGQCLCNSFHQHDDPPCYFIHLVME